MNNQTLLLCTLCSRLCTHHTLHIPYIIVHIHSIMYRLDNKNNFWSWKFNLCSNMYIYGISCVYFPDTSHILYNYILAHVTKHHRAYFIQLATRCEEKATTRRRLWKYMYTHRQRGALVKLRSFAPQKCSSSREKLFVLPFFLFFLFVEVL